MLPFLDNRKIPTVSLKQGGGVAGKGRIAESRSRTYRRRKTHFYLHHGTTREVLDFVTQGKEYFPGYLKRNSFLSPRSELLPGAR